MEEINFSRHKYEGFEPFENELLVKSELLIQEQRNHIEELQDEYKKLQEDLKSENKKFQQTIQNLKDENIKLKIQQEILNSEITVLQQSEIKNKKTIGRFNQKIKVLTETNRELEHQKDILKNEINQLNDTLNNINVNKENPEINETYQLINEYKDDIYKLLIEHV